MNVKEIKGKINLIEAEIGEYIMSLDIGKHETEAIGRNIMGTAENIKRVYHRTKLYDLEDGYIDVEGNSHKITFEDKEYIIGEQGERKSLDTSKTNLLHKLSAYVAISQYLEPDTHNKIYLVLACPLSVLKIQEAKEEYKNFIKGNCEISVVVDGKNYYFIIQDITIKAEGSGIRYLDPERFKNKTVGVMDLGGLNMGFSLYRNGVCKQGDRFIEEFAANELTIRVQDAMTVIKKGNLVSYDEAEEILENGYMTKQGEIIAESMSKIKDVKKNFLQDAEAIIQRKGFKLDQLDELIFVGGLTQKLKEQITIAYPKISTIPDNSQWTTVEGLYKVACAKYSK